jgi:hypothetical protein
MIDGSDKLLMEHRNRQIDAAAKRIAELEAENAALKTGGTQLASTNSAMDAIAAIQGALRIESLWLPHIIDEEHKGEAEALHAMRNSFLLVVQQLHQ